MQKATLIVATVACLVWGSTALADASCGKLKQAGNTWNLYCSADDSGSDERDYQCDYVLSITSANGETQQVEAQGSVGHGVQNAIIWSGIQADDGGDITDADIVSGQCTQQ